MVRSERSQARDYLATGDRKNRTKVPRALKENLYEGADGRDEEKKGVPIRTGRLCVDKTNVRWLVLRDALGWLKRQRRGQRACPFALHRWRRSCCLRRWGRRCCSDREFSSFYAARFRACRGCPPFPLG